MRNLLNIVYFTMIYLLKNCSPECTQYYLVLERSFELVGDEIMSNILPLTMNEIEHKPLFNITENAKILRDNKDCILEFKCGPSCQMNSITSCFKTPNITAAMGTDEHAYWETSRLHISSKIPLNTEPTIPVETLTETPITDFTKTETPVTDYTKTETPVTDNTKTETPVTDYTKTETLVTDYTKTETPITDSTKSPVTVDLNVANADTKTMANFESSSVDFEETTEYAMSYNESALYANNEKKEIAKKAAIAVVGVTGASALAYFIAKKIQHLLQYGAYHLPG